MPDDEHNTFVTKVKGMPESMVLVNVHPMDNCAGRPCVIHHPSDHHMREWPLDWDNDNKTFYRECQHGMGHPDPDQFAFWDEMAAKWDTMQQGQTMSLTAMVSPPSNPWTGRGIHLCDGCCCS